MPDLGPYATYVMLAYVVSLALLAGIVLVSWMQSRQVKRRLEDAEERRRHG